MEETKKIIDQLRSRPGASVKIEVGKPYLHIPEEDATLPEQDDYWTFTLLPNGIDINLEQVATRNGNAIFENNFSYEDIKVILAYARKNGIPGNDVLAYRAFADAILVHRQGFAKEILNEGKLSATPYIKYRTFPVYRVRESVCDPIPHPILVFCETSNWEVRFRHMVSFKKFNTSAIVETKLFEADWRNEEAIKQAVEILTNESKYRELEIQAVLSR